MKKMILLISVLILGAASVWAGEMPEGWKPPVQSAELQRVKALEGTWTGENPGMDGKPHMMTVNYKLTSGGSAVVETLNPGGEHEMVSVYHDVNGKLSMTHYCMLGNQPQLELKDSSTTTLSLGESAASEALLSGQSRMAQVILETPDPATLKQTWISKDASGKPQKDPVVFTLKKA